MEYRTYPIRWYICCVLSFVNALNAYIWLAFAPVTNQAVTYYDTSETVINIGSLIFPLVTLLLGFPAALIVDQYGTKLVLIVVGLLHFLASVLRLLSTHTLTGFSPMTSLILYLIGQLVASLAQPLVMFAPTSLAFIWFPDKQRATANALSALGNPLGVMLCSAITPVFVKDSTGIAKSNWSTLGLTIFALVITVPAVLKSKPTTPPSESAKACEEYQALRQDRNFCLTLRIFLKNCITPLKIPGFWLMMIQFGFALAFFTCTSTLLQQMLCPKGYTNDFAGMVGALMIAAGIVFGGIVSPIVDKTGYLLPGVLICYMLALLGAAGWSISLFYTQMNALIIISLMWMGAFGLASYSLFLELAAEVTYPVPEAISTGLLIMFSQLMTIVAIPVLMAVSVPVKDTYGTCGDTADPLDYSIPNTIFIFVGILVGIFNTVCLRMPYRRRELEQGRRATFNSTENGMPVSPDSVGDNDVANETMEDYLENSTVNVSKSQLQDENGPPERTHL